ncbi:MULTISPECIES: glycosyltransferase family 2 protein [Paenibacillus]|uniref:glycosyltransferase family 2 protein n=1 Tax=Paenibacillus TaxID=44249 RepID=UPI0004BB71DC|nr:glycosyltransferase family 2 protein [Paenibacillus sp. IHBB 10380]
MNMTISVIIPTYKRVDALQHCLEGIQRQTRYPDEIMLVVRNTDERTLNYLRCLNIRNTKIALIEGSGVIAALNAGIRQSTGSVIVLTDDDTVPHTNWLEQLERHYVSNSEIGGVGGRDIVFLRGHEIPAGKQEVGIIKPYGRIIGNHHVGIGSAREVDILKGANMSFRREAICGLAFDERMKGTGAQVHNELEFSLAVKKKGWKLIYDPTVCVDHFPAERFDEDQRNSFNETAFLNAVHNETYAVLKHFGTRHRALYVLWVLIVGSKASPGIIQFLRMFPRERTAALKKVWLAYKGRWDGWRTWRGSLE